jgi:hypothetical protein
VQSGHGGIFSTPPEYNRYIAKEEIAAVGGTESAIVGLTTSAAGTFPEGLDGFDYREHAD